MKDTRESGQPPNFLHNEERHLKIKHQRQLANYQIRFFQKERRRCQKMLDKLNANQEYRAEVYGAKYKSRQELDEAYMLGGMTDKEYMKQRSAIWNAYSDRGYIMRIEWLDQMIDFYQQRLDKIDEWIEVKRKDTRKQIMKRYYKRQKHYAYKRRKRREARSEKKKQEYKELKERWKYYGLR